MKAVEILKKEYGSEWKEIYSEIQKQVNDVLSSGGSYDEVEDILMDYALEMDYIFEFIGV
jgi:Iap family predicted aminopeptidase